MIHVSAKHKLVGVPVSPTIANLFPDARQVDFSGTALALVRHSFYETKMLRELGHDIPAPVLSQYEWPHQAGKPPFDVQRKTVAMLTTNQRAYVLNGMGTGKTRSALWAFDYLRSIGQAKRMLVVAPLSTLNFTWAREVFATFPHLSCTVLHHPTKEKRLQRLDEKHDIYIINPDGLAVLKDELIARVDIDCMCIDELAVFRKNNGKRNRAAKEIARTKVWAWGMTGSPTPTEPTDAYGQCMILTPKTVPKRFSHFRDATMERISQFRYVPKRDAKDVVFSVMQPAVRFTLDDVVELPDLVEQVVDIGIGPKQTLVYDAVRDHAYFQVGQGEVTAANAGAVLNKLLQISIGYVYHKKPSSDVRETMVLDNTARLDRLVDDINACTNKVIVFAPFTHAIHGIAERLADEGMELAVIDGSVSSRERDGIFATFQNTNKYRVIVAHPGTMAHGVTLTAADTIIWFGPVTSLETFEQANARIRRIGQNKKQLILMYQGTKAEKKMYSGLRSKQRVQDGLLKLFAEAQL